MITFDDRPSDSPVVERVWRSRSDHAGAFHSMASCNWAMVVTRLAGRTFMTVRGPETRASSAECPPHGDWVGINFGLGTSLPMLPPATLRDRHDVTLPAASPRAFVLDGATWEYPTFENAEAFVARLVRAGLVATDPHVADVLRGDGSRSRRTDQRRVRCATGMTHATIRQIRRARRAAILLRRGVPIADVVYDAGYYDQPHLARALRRFIGLPPAQVAADREQLSLLYKTPDD
ncbi:MAG: helix-turn-helix domain-containing protein [Deltaproteobacteria bacterium]|nr:helix-turn-helix domain-containing protein [Deltaproteobacteria bacterium]